MARMQHHSDRPESDERGRGLITKTDRGYYVGTHSVTDEHARNIRSKARYRMYDAILDFTVLFRHVGDYDLEQVFTEFDEDEGKAQRQFDSAIMDAMALFYYLEPELFADRVRKAVKRGLRREGWLADVDVDIDIERERSLEDVYEDVTESGEVYDEEAALLRQHNRMTFAEQVGYQWHVGERGDEQNYGIPVDVDDPKVALEFVTLPRAAREHGDEARQAVRVAYDALERFQSDDAVPPKSIGDRIMGAVYPLYPLGFESDREWWNEAILPTLSRIGAKPPWLNVRSVTPAEDTTSNSSADEQD